MNEKEWLNDEFRKLKAAGIKPNFAAVARIYGLTRQTAKKYYEYGGVPERKPKRTFSKWDPYEKEIEQKLAVPGITIRGLHRYFSDTLGEDKLPGTYESLKAYIHKKGFSR